MNVYFKDVPKSFFFLFLFFIQEARAYFVPYLDLIIGRYSCFKLFTTISFVNCSFVSYDSARLGYMACFRSKLMFLFIYFCGKRKRLYFFLSPVARFKLFLNIIHIIHDYSLVLCNSFTKQGKCISWRQLNKITDPTLVFKQRNPVRKKHTSACV